MSQVRYARFRKNGGAELRRATAAEIKVILEDYIGEAGKVEPDEEDLDMRWTVVLPGKPSFPFKRIHPSMDVQQHEERWIEICLFSRHLIVATRQMDEYTNNVADGIVRMLARFYSAKLEMPE